jgi:hypothetical protein
MVKIPTFESRTRITAEPAGVTTGIRVSPTATPAAALSKVAKVAEDYYIKQRDNTEKLEAKEKFFEMKSESDKIIESQKNNADEFQSVEIYNEKFGSYRKQQLSLIKNKRVKKRLETLLDIDQAENVYNIKKNSFKAMEAKSNEIYNQEQNSLGVKRTLETDPNKKKQIQDQQIESAREYENIHGMGDAWLNKETKKIIGDNELFDVEKAVARKDYRTAINLLKQSTSIDQDDVEKQLIKIEKESAEYNETSIYTEQFLKGGSLVGVNFKNTTEKKVLQNSENILIATAQKNNLNVEETFAIVDEVFSKGGELSPTYKDLFETGYNTGSITTFDSPADVPKILVDAVKSAEIADRTGRLNVYTTQEQERFYKNVIVLKSIGGLSDFQAIKQAKDFEMNYDKEILRGSNKSRKRTLTELESEFSKSKATNIGEVKSYANKLFDIYVANGIDPRKAEKEVIKDIKNSIVEIDNHAYLKRDIEAFKSIGNMVEIKSMKEYILKTRLPDENPDDFFLRHNGGGQFEIRREVDISPVNDNDGQPLIFYAKDLFNLNQERQQKARTQLKEEVIKEQEEKQLRKEETEAVGLGVTGA